MYHCVKNENPKSKLPKLHNSTNSITHILTYSHTHALHPLHALYNLLLSTHPPHTLTITHLPNSINFY